LTPCGRCEHSLRAPLPQAGRPRSSCRRPCVQVPRPPLSTPAESRSRLRATRRRTACARSTLSLASARSKSRSGNARTAAAPRPEPQVHPPRRFPAHRTLRAACNAVRNVDRACARLTATPRGGASIPCALHFREPVDRAPAEVGRDVRPKTAPGLDRSCSAGPRPVAPSRDLPARACARSTLSLASARSKSRSGNARAADAPRPEPQVHPPRRPGSPCEASEATPARAQRSAAAQASEAMPACAQRTSPSCPGERSDAVFAKRAEPPRPRRAKRCRCARSGVALLRRRAQRRRVRQAS
jgi:hypothetical protein